MQHNPVLTEIVNKYGEWIEMADNKPQFIIDLLSKIILEERQKNSFYEKRLKNYETKLYGG